MVVCNWVVILSVCITVLCVFDPTGRTFVKLRATKRRQRNLRTYNLRSVTWVGGDVLVSFADWRAEEGPVPSHIAQQPHRATALCEGLSLTAFSVLEKVRIGWVWWYTPSIPALTTSEAEAFRPVRGRPSLHSKFKASQSYSVRF